MSELLQIFKDRFKDALHSADRANLFTNNIVEMADQLAESVTSPIADDDLVGIEAAYYIGYFHLARYRALPAGEDLAELAASLSWYGQLAATRPDLVPAEIAVIVKPTSIADRTNEQGSIIGAQLQTLRESLVSGDLTILDSSAEEIVSIAQRDIQGSEDQAHVLALINSAYRTFSRIFDNPLALQRSIPWARQAVSLTEGTESEHDYLKVLASTLWEAYQTTESTDILAECEPLARRLAEWPEQDSEETAESFSHVAVILKMKYKASHTMPELLEAIAYCQRAVDSVAQDSPTRPRHLSNLSEGFWDAYCATQDQEFLDRVIKSIREAIVAVATRVDESEHYFSNLAAALRARAEHIGDRDAYDEWIQACRYAVAAAAPDIDRAKALVRLSQGLEHIADVFQDPDVLPESLTALREATNFDSSAELQNLLVGALRDSFERGGPESDIDEAIVAARGIIEDVPNNDERYPMLVQNLAGVLESRYSKSKNLADISQAIKYGYLALSALPENAPEQPDYQKRIADRLVLRASASETPIVDVDAAIALYLNSYAGASDDPIALAIAGALMSAQILRYKLTGDVSCLKFVENDERLEPILAAASTVQRSDYLSALAARLHDRFEALGRTEDIDRAVELSRMVLDFTDSADRPLYGAYLAAFLRTRYAKLGCREDIDEAMRLFLSAASSTTLGPFERARQYAHLGGAYVERFKRFASLTDLDDGVAACRRAVELSTLDDPSYDHHLSHLALTLGARAEFRGNKADLEECEVIYLRAAELASSEASRADMTYNAALMIGRRANLTEQVELLDSSIALLRKSLQLLPRGSDKGPLYLSMIGSRFMERHRLSGRSADFNEAIAICRRSVNECRSGHPNYVLCMTNLGAALSRKAADAPSGPERQEAVGIFRTLMTKLSSESPERIAVGNNLATLLSTDAAMTDAERDEAIALLRWLSQTPLLAAEKRVSAAISLSQLLTDVNNEEALAAYQTAVSLVPLAAWHGIPRAARERVLKQWTGLGAAAAELALSLEKPDIALELLEGSRSVLWQQMLEKRFDAEAMRGVPEPIAKRMHEIRTLLDT